MTNQINQVIRVGVRVGVRVRVRVGFRVRVRVGFRVRVGLGFFNPTLTPTKTLTQP